MTSRMPIAGLVMVLIAGHPEMSAAPLPLELKWNELNPAIFGHPVEITMPGAITIKGEVAAEREDGLVLDIKRTSDAKAFPKGNAVIPRSAVTLLKLERKSDSHWRTTGAVLGVLGGVVLGGYIAGKTATDAGPGIAIFLTSASAIAIVGSYAGRAAGKRATLIRVVP